MTTGFVRPVVEDGISFAQFVWNCASAFDFLARRNDVRHVEIAATVDDAHERARLDEAQTELESFRALDQQGRLAFLRAARNEASERLQRARIEQAEENAKIAAMVEKVRAWDPPKVEPLPALKDFMLHQLQISTSTWEACEPPEPMHSDAHRHLATLERRVQSLREEIAQIHVHHRKRSAWIEALLHSVPQPEEK